MMRVVDRVDKEMITLPESKEGDQECLSFTQKGVEQTLVAFVSKPLDKPFFFFLANIPAFVGVNKQHRAVEVVKM